MSSAYFNPRSREGSDVIGSVLGGNTLFQSTLPRGERRRAISRRSRSWLFQSTLPRGERQHGRFFCGYHRYFNPRSREGSDAGDAPYLYSKIKFQSALPRGERRIRLILQTSDQLFQSALPRGERQPLTFCISAFLYFNPRSREGSDEISRW